MDLQPTRPEADRSQNGKAVSAGWKDLALPNRKTLLAAGPVTREVGAHIRHEKCGTRAKTDGHTVNPQHHVGRAEAKTGNEQVVFAQTLTVAGPLDHARTVQFRNLVGIYTPVFQDYLRMFSRPWRR